MKCREVDKLMTERARSSEFRIALMQCLGASSVRKQVDVRTWTAKA